MRPGRDRAEEHRAAVAQLDEDVRVIGRGAAALDADPHLEGAGAIDGHAIGLDRVEPVLGPRTAAARRRVAEAVHLAFDVRAEREFEQQTVGLEVRGTALLPILDVYSDPPLDQAEALSYLVLGRPLRSASGADGAQLGQAAAAIGGNLLAGQLGDRIGLDIGVADSKALGGAAVSVGKYLSPRLYLGYGVSLFGSGQVVTFKYIINRLWEAEVESGRENRVGLNYTLER